MEPTENDPSGGVRPWERLASRPGPDLIICRARFDSMRNPRTDEVFERVVLETRSWVNVVALTPARELVVVRQYRFGTQSVTTEIPGGVIDPGEESQSAAQRELREECGHTAARWTYLGCTEPNPAFHDNLCHHWLAEDCVRTHEQELDAGEDIEIGVVTFAEMRRRIHAGEVRHSLVVTALSRVMDLSWPDLAARDPAPQPT